MKILLLNQTFYPDVASTAQHLSDLALGLVERGHEVTVIASRRAYDNPEKIFPARETWRGIRIIRIGSTGLGKGARWKRAVDFASFSAACALRLAFLPRRDAVVALTSPPLISFLGAWLTRLRGGKFFYWVMDFNPDEAIAAGWLRPNSLVARLLDAMSRFSLRRARRIIALDRFMRDRIIAKNISPEKVVVMPPWSHEDEVRFDSSGRERFRRDQGLSEKFVVMYSGNHSPCHPLTTLLEAARRLASDDGVRFCFIGGGSEFKRVQEFAREHRLANIVCFPYQPLRELSASLSAADLHVVVMGDPFVGLVHPCKIYNILAVGAPVLYIGPQPSHLSEIAARIEAGEFFCSAPHGAVELVMTHISNLRARRKQRPESFPTILASFSKQTLLPRLIAELESA